MYQKILAASACAMAMVILAYSIHANWDRLQGRAPAPQIQQADGQGGAATAQAQTTGPGRFMEQFDASNLTIPEEDILRGGPPKDGIPALTAPHHAPVSEADFLDAEDRVVGVSVEGEARAYPIRLLNWHEIVNDELAGEPFAVVYCPLCDSASVIGRRINGEVLEFGVSGLLHNSNVILYDRTHDALWSQIGFSALSGPYAGQELPHLPFELTTFGQWRRDHPDGTVASFQTDYPRNYRSNPYDSYFEADRLMFPAKGSDDTRLGEKEPVLGIKIGDAVRAYPIDAIASGQEGRIEDELGGHTIVLEASRNPSQVKAVSAPDDARVVHTFWFAWVSFHPDTTLYQAE
ncbi:MAG: DUF3179 domain-containing protein [Candidatus Hydrogenedentota bacterium]